MPLQIYAHVQYNVCDFLTQLPNALSRCHFALARCYLQRASFTSRLRVVTNMPLCFYKWVYLDTARHKLIVTVRLDRKPKTMVGGRYLLFFSTLGLGRGALELIKLATKQEIWDFLKFKLVIHLDKKELCVIY